MLQMGDRVAIQGNAASYTLSNPAHVYTGTVVDYDDGNVVVRLDEPVRYQQTDLWTQEVSVQTTSCRKLA
jgi:hypothetical protein